MNPTKASTQKLKDYPGRTHRPPFVVESFGVSDPGRVRDSNEDCFAVAELSRTLQVQQSNFPQSRAAWSCNRAYVFLVADGVGGNKAGEVASELSVLSIEAFLLNTLKRFSNLRPAEERSVLDDFQKAVVEADARLFEESANHPEWHGMGTTLTMAFAVNWRLFVAHAGDCRCYLYSGRRLQRLTQDHTLTAELIRHGVVAPEEQDHHRWRHVVTNALGGTEPGVQVELHSVDLHAGDRLLLCSDGLSDGVPESEIAAVLETSDGPRNACERLVRAANERGGKDNITAIVATIKEKW